MRTTNDAAVTWPPRRATTVIAAYFTGSTRSQGAGYAVIAEVGGIVASAFG